MKRESQSSSVGAFIGPWILGRRLLPLPGTRKLHCNAGASTGTITPNVAEGTWSGSAPAIDGPLVPVTVTVTGSAREDWVIYSKSGTGGVADSVTAEQKTERLSDVCPGPRRPRLTRGWRGSFLLRMP